MNMLWEFFVCKNLPESRKISPIPNVFFVTEILYLKFSANIHRSTGYFKIIKRWGFP